MSDCLFCKIVKKEIPAKLIYEDDKVIAFEDIDPKAPVHALIVSKEHIPAIVDLKEEELLGNILKAVKKISKDKGLEKKGFRLVNNYLKDGGQAVFHLHFHLLGGRKMTWPPG